MSILPLLLSLPSGVIAGVPTSALSLPAGEGGLASFGPHLHTEPELRHAAFSPPRRLVVSLPSSASVATDAALAAMADTGAAIVLLADDLAALLRLSHRILVSDIAGAWRWEAAAVLGARRVLCLRMVGIGGERRLRLPVGREGVEPMLADYRARGWSVRESRVEYAWTSAR